MDLLLLLFAIPLAIVIYSIILQKLINSPILVALSVFTIFLIVAIVQGDTTIYILTIVYAILAYVTAVLTNIIRRIIDRCMGENNSDNGCVCPSMNNVEVDFNKESLGTSQEVITNNNCGCNRRSWR